jgi:hypothetical protein
MLEQLAYDDFTGHYRFDELLCRALKEVEMRRNISYTLPLYRRSELGYNMVLLDLDKIDAPRAMLSACSIYDDFYRTYVMPFFSSEVAIGEAG